jgi:PAS domain
LDANPPPVAPFPPTRHWKIAALWDYWCGVRVKCGRMPLRSDIDPIDIPKLLPNIWLVDIEPGTGRYRYRVVGTAVTRARNNDQTGGYLDEEVPGLNETAFGRSLALTAREGIPTWNIAPPPAALPLHDIAEAERLTLPLAGEDRPVAMLLNLTVYRLRSGEML